MGDVNSGTRILSVRLTRSGGAAVDDRAALSPHVQRIRIAIAPSDARSTPPRNKGAPASSETEHSLARAGDVKVSSGRRMTRVP